MWAPRLLKPLLIALSRYTPAGLVYFCRLMTLKLCRMISKRLRHYQRVVHPCRKSRFEIWAAAHGSQHGTDHNQTSISVHPSLGKLLNNWSALPSNSSIKYFLLTKIMADSETTHVEPAPIVDTRAGNFKNTNYCTCETKKTQRRWLRAKLSLRKQNRRTKYKKSRTSGPAGLVSPEDAVTAGLVPPSKKQPSVHEAPKEDTKNVYEAPKEDTKIVDEAAKKDEKRYKHDSVDQYNQHRGFRHWPLLQMRRDKKSFQSTACYASTSRRDASPCFLYTGSKKDSSSYGLIFGNKLHACCVYPGSRYIAKY